MLELISKYKYIIIAVVAVIILFSLFGGGSPEDAAEDYVKSMLKGDYKKCVDLTSDEAIARSGEETRKLYSHKMEKALKALEERYKDKYGSGWKYKVKVVDSYEYTPQYVEYAADELTKVIISVEHKGGGWFNDKEGSEDMEVIVGKENGKWRVISY